MVDDAIMFSSLLVTPVQNEEFEETLINLNVSQWLCEKEPIKRVLRT